MAFCCFQLLMTSCSSVEQKFGIIFTANLDGNQDIYRAQSSDFQSIEQLTFTPTDPETNLYITKYGTRILFYVPNRIASEYPTASAADSHTHILELKTKKTIDIGYPLGLKTTVIPQAWSLEEDKILFSGSEGFIRKIYTTNSEGKNPQELDIPISKGSFPFEIRYSPDGEQISYTENSYFSGEFELVMYTPFIYDFRTESATRLGDGLTDCWRTQWSPVGKQILLFCNLSTDGETTIPQIRLFDINSDGNNIVTNEIAEFDCGGVFAWSLSGKQFVAHCETDNNQNAITIFNSNGSVQKEILDKDIPIEESAYIKELAWSPDGQKILYIAGSDENSLNIYMMDADGSNNHAITTQPSNYSELSVYSLEP